MLILFFNFNCSGRFEFDSNVGFEFGARAGSTHFSISKIAKEKEVVMKGNPFPLEI